MFARRLFTASKLVQQCRRGFSTREVTPATRRKNLAMALALVGFIGGVYYHSINKMKQVRVPILSLVLPY